MSHLQRKQATLGAVSKASLIIAAAGIFATACAVGMEDPGAEIEAGGTSALGTTEAELNLDAPDGASFAARHDLSSAAYQAEVESRLADGYRLTDVDGYDEDGSTRFAALFEKVDGPAWSAKHGLTSSALQDEVTNRKRDGYYPVVADGYSVGGTVRYAAIFHENTDDVDWRMRHDMSSSTYSDEYNAAKDDGYRLVHVSGHDSGGSSRFTAIWTKDSGPSMRAHHDMSSSTYQTRFEDYKDDGYRVVHIDEYYVGDTRKYAAIWHKDSTATAARHGLTSSAYTTAYGELRAQGYRPVAISATGNGSSERFATVWRNQYYSVGTLADVDSVVESAMTAADVRGLSLAIARNGRLKFAKAYGKMDDSADATTKTRFRWASVSKPITSAMIQRLIQDGDLNLTDRVFGTGALLGNTHRPDDGFTARQRLVTVQHLLEHTAGGWGNSSDDPMFRNEFDGFDHDELIEATLADGELPNAPGTRHDYSNFGYCILGRIIERITGQDYDDAVRDEFLDPAGADSFVIGGDHLSDRLSDEAKYYHDDGSPYGRETARMDSHGGWVGTPIDLLRWARRVDGEGTAGDYINAASITRMTTWTSACSSSSSCYAQGWKVSSSDNWTHNGYLLGSLSRLVRMANGDLMAAVVNETHKDTDIDLANLLTDVRAEFGTLPTSANLF